MKNKIGVNMKIKRNLNRPVIFVDYVTELKKNESRKYLFSSRRKSLKEQTAIP